MRAALAAALLTLLTPSPARADGCPDGTAAAAGGGCARDAGAPQSPFLDTRRGAFRGAPCPQGTHKVQSTLGFRCVGGAAAPVEKVLASGAARAPVQAAAPEGPPRGSVPFRAEGLEVSLPRGWHVTDAWSDEVPTVYVELDARRAGKPVTLLVSRLSPGQPGFEAMPEAIAKEKEYQGAKEGPPLSVSGVPARQTVVAGDSRSAYVPAGKGAYYLLSYSAPKDVFSLYEPAFDRLLATARLGSR